MIVKTLRGYQADLYRRVNRARSNGKDAVMLLPTGAGKTIIARNHCSHILNHQNHFGIRRIIITTPQRQILEGFKRTNNENWYIAGKHSTQKIENIEIVEIPNNSIVDFLRGSSGVSIAISCIQSITNQTSNAFNAFETFSDCSDILWVIDEAHHIESEKTANIINDFKTKNGKILYLTATPFTVNGALDILANPDVEIIHRSLGEHMEDGFAPEIEMSYEIFNTSAGSQIEYGSIIPQNNMIADWASKIAHSYEQDSRPKTLIIIPSFSTTEDSSTAEVATTLKKELEKIIKDVKVLSVVGYDSSGETAKIIETEANSFPGHDIIIACRRFDEGTDVPAISAVYLIGMTSYRRIIQLMGRALRNKKDISGFSQKYEKYVNKSIFKFFIFNENNTDDEYLKQKQYCFSLSAIKTIEAVQNFTNISNTVGPIRIRRRIQSLIEDLVETDHNNENIEIYEELINEIERNIILIETNGDNDNHMLGIVANTKIGNTNQEALECCSDFTKAYIESTIISEVIKTEKEVDEFINSSINIKRTNRNLNAIQSNISEIVKKYSNNKIKYTESELVKSFTTRLNITTLVEWGELLKTTHSGERAALEKAKDLVAFYSEHGKLPKTNSLEENERKTAIFYNNIKQAYNNKNTNIAYESVVTYLKENMGEFILNKIDDMQQQINTAIRYVDFIKRTGKKPSQHSGDPVEKRLDGWFNQIKIEYNSKNGKRIIYPETVEYLIEELGENILNKINRENIQLSRAVEYVNWFKIHNRKPSFIGETEAEVSLCMWFNQTKSKFLGISCGGRVLYPSVISYLTDNLGNSFLNSRKQENPVMIQARKYVAFFNENKRRPKNNKNSNDVEKQMYIWFKQFRVEYNNNSKFRNMHKMVGDYFIKEIDANIFKQTRTGDQIKRAVEYVEWVKKNNREASQYSESAIERSLGTWIIKQKINNKKNKINSVVLNYLVENLGVDVLKYKKNN